MLTAPCLKGSFERDILAARDLHECSALCLSSLESKGFLCRSFNYDEAGLTCILYDEDPLIPSDGATSFSGGSMPHVRMLHHMKPSAGHLYRIHCVNEKGE